MDFLRTLAEIRTPALNVIFQYITYFGQELIIVGLICWLYWCGNKKLAQSMVFSFFISASIVNGLKVLFRIPRPWVIDPDFKPVESAMDAATGYSFPSGHTQTATSGFGMIFLHRKEMAAKIVCLVLIGLVAFSRMYLGCHQPKDVICAFLIAFAVDLLTYHFIYRKEVLNLRPAVWFAVFLIISIVLGGCTVVLTTTGRLEASLGTDNIKASAAGIAFSLGWYLEQKYVKFVVPEDKKQKLIRFAAGIATTLVFFRGLKPLLGTSYPGSFARYFIVIFWILLIYPLIFKTVGKKKA